jgi:acyl carrier protein
MNIETYTKCFMQGLNIEDLSVLENLEYNSIPEWDSIGHMSLIAQLEETFNITLDTNEVIDFSSYKVGLEILRKHNIVF